MNARTRTASAPIDFFATERKTRRLIELQGLSFEIGGRTLFQDLDFILTPGTRVGLVGPNGSGKTTLLRLLSRELSPAAGEIRTADALSRLSTSIRTVCSIRMSRCVALLRLTATPSSTRIA